MTHARQKLALGAGDGLGRGAVFDQLGARCDHRVECPPDLLELVPCADRDAGAPVARREASRRGGERAKGLHEQPVGDRMDAKPDCQKEHGHQGDLGREAPADGGVDARQAKLDRGDARDVRSARRIVGTPERARQPVVVLAPATVARLGLVGLAQERQQRRLIRRHAWRSVRVRDHDPRGVHDRKTVHVAELPTEPHHDGLELPAPQRGLLGEEVFEHLEQTLRRALRDPVLRFSKEIVARGREQQRGGHHRAEDEQGDSGSERPGARDHGGRRTPRPSRTAPAARNVSGR